MKGINSKLDQMECLYLSVYDITLSLCNLATSSAYSPELERAVKHVQQVYFNLVAEVRGKVTVGAAECSATGVVVSIYG
jgi:hypothetical protein